MTVSAYDTANVSVSSAGPAPVVNIPSHGLIVSGSNVIQCTDRSAMTRLETNSKTDNLHVVLICLVSETSTRLVTMEGVVTMHQRHTRPWDRHSQIQLYSARGLVALKAWQ